MRRLLPVLFIGANVLILTLVYLLGMRGRIDEWHSANQTIHMQESRLQIKEQNLSALEKNREALSALALIWHEHEKRVPEYALITDSFTNMAKQARLFRLIEMDFRTDEPVTHETTGEGERIVEIKAIAAYEGAYIDLCAFIGVLCGDGRYAVDRLTITQDAADNHVFCASVTFSVYGIEG